MKRIWALALLLTGCAPARPVEENEAPASQGAEATATPRESEEVVEEAGAAEDEAMVKIADWEVAKMGYDTLGDSRLPTHLENLVYQETVAALDSEEYLVENVTARYFSKEYLEEMDYNSRENIYFGCTLAELEEIFQGEKFLFTLGGDGRTVVRELETLEDHAMEEMLRDVAIGAGVILICVTVSAVTAGAAPAVSVIFAASAQNAAIGALFSTAFGGVAAGVTRGIETGDFNEALDAAAEGAANGFKWGAISGAVIGGGVKAFELKAATKGGLTMKQAAKIQQESRLPNHVIAEMGSMEEYTAYQQAGLEPMLVNGKTALIQDVDLTYESTLADGSKVTNLARMNSGRAPLEPATGNAYELHHMGQQSEGTLAVLTRTQHRGEGNFATIHRIWTDSVVDHGAEWNKTTKEFWTYLGHYYSQNVA